MIFVLLLTLLVSILLAITGELPPLVAAGLTAGCLFSLAVMFWQHLQRMKRLSHRIRQSKAQWGSTALHLGGLPVPLETQGLLLLANHELMFESDNLNHTFALDRVHSILALSAEQLRQLSDTRISTMLGSSSCQSLVVARERIRKGDRRLRNSTILLMYYHEDWQTQETMSIVILSLSQRSSRLEALNRHEEIRSLIKIYRPIKRKSVFAKPATENSKHPKGD